MTTYIIESLKFIGHTNWSTYYFSENSQPFENEETKNLSNWRLTRTLSDMKKEKEIRRRKMKMYCTIYQNFFRGKKLD